MKRIVSEIKEITPAMAEQFLSNLKKRPLNRDVVQAYVEQLRVLQKNPKEQE